MRELLNAAQVGKALGRSAGWFLRKRQALEAENGFPRPVDGCGLRWDPAAIGDWLDARRRREALDPIAAGEAELIRRARAQEAGAPA